jgi:hypothetical protein
MYHEAFAVPLESMWCATITIVHLLPPQKEMDKLRVDMQKATVLSPSESAGQLPTAGAGPSDVSAGTKKGGKAEAEAEAVVEEEEEEEEEEDFDYQVEDDEIEESDAEDDDR